MLHATWCLSLWQLVEEHLHAEDELDTVWEPSFSGFRPRLEGQGDVQTCRATRQDQTKYSKETIQFIQRTSTKSITQPQQIQ